jgi:ribosome-associated protein
MEIFKLNTDYIELIGLLQVVGLASTGGHAKKIVESGKVVRNGQVELRKRAKLIDGDLITVKGLIIKIEKEIGA